MLAERPISFVGGARNVAKLLSAAAQQGQVHVEFSTTPRRVNQIKRPEV